MELSSMQPSKSTESQINQTDNRYIDPVLVNCEPFAPLTSVIYSVGHIIIRITYVMIEIISKLLSLSLSCMLARCPRLLAFRYRRRRIAQALSREGSSVELLISGVVEDRFSHLDIMPLVGPNPSRASRPFVLGALVRGPALFAVLNCQ